MAEILSGTVPFTRALLFSLPVLLGLLWISISNPKGDYWGTVEDPKAQCEAYDAQRLNILKRATRDIYAKEKLDRVIREPQNTLSNLAYCTAGMAILFAGKRRLSRSLGLAAVFLGIGSGLYHASLLPEWRLVDILGVYVVLFSVVGLGVAALCRKPPAPTTQTGIGIGVWLGAFAGGIFRNDVRIFGFKALDSTYIVIAAVFLGFWVGLIAGRRVKNKKAYWSVFFGMAVLSAIAFAGGLGDRFGDFWANPEAPIQGHTVWHLFGALALLAAYQVFTYTGFDRSLFARPTQHGDQQQDPG